MFTSTSKNPSSVVPDTSSKDSRLDRDPRTSRMRVAQLVAGLLLPIAVFAAKAKDPSSVFARYHKKATSSTPITLDDHSFSTIASTPRDYGFAVCLTALAAQFGCKACQDFDPEWSILGKSWMKAGIAEDHRMLIGTLDFLDGRQTFQSVGQAADSKVTAGKEKAYWLHCPPAR